MYKRSSWNQFEVHGLRPLFRLVCSPFGRKSYREAAKFASQTRKGSLATGAKPRLVKGVPAAVAPNLEHGRGRRPALRP